MTHESPWHVLHVVANHEKRVAQHLTSRSLEHYLPLYTQRSKWSDRSVLLERPLFTGYIFVRFTPQERRTLISTPGVLRLLGDQDTDTVSAEELQRIQEGLAQGYVMRPHASIPVGTAVQVRSGVFEGVIGKVAEIRRECKVIIAMSAVQQCFSLEVGLDDVEVLKADLKIDRTPPPVPMVYARA